jgi:hypothetical protein
VSDFTANLFAGPPTIFFIGAAIIGFFAPPKGLDFI